MKPQKFKTKIENGKIDAKTRGNLAACLQVLDGERVEISVRKLSGMRTSRQNRTIHAIFTEISEVFRAHGLDQKITIEADPTAENIKIFFKEKFLDGKSTSACTTAELARAFDVFLQAVNQYLISNGGEPLEIRGAEIESLLATEFS